MRIIKIDASNWTKPLDIYHSLFIALGSPDWHGASIDALIESMVYGEINEIDPPYTVQVFSSRNVPPEVEEELRLIENEIKKARERIKSTDGEDVNVNIEIIN